MQEGYGRSFSPVNVGDEVDVKIEGVGEKGDGFAKVKGFVLFVPNTKEGDEVRVKITRVLKKVGFAEVVGEASVEPQAMEEPGVAEEEQQAPQESEEPAEDAAEEPQEQPEDSEDFGEELDDQEEKKE